MSLPPCRLYVLLAREATVGVILRRGPSQWVQVIRWNVADDTLDAGHWFRGRIYPERCDLSPSGKKLIYFAAKHRPSRDPSYTSAWTAISNVPYLTAVALWPNHGTTYFGGGLFTAENRILLRSLDATYFDPAERTLEPHPDHRPPKNVIVRAYPFPVWPEYVRLLRDGWTWNPDGTGTVELKRLADPAMTAFPLAMYRRLAGFPHVLSVCLTGTTGTYTLRTPGGIDIPDLLSDVEWADQDHGGRLICARNGKLFDVRRRLTDGTFDWCEIADFNDMKPQPKAPPEAARHW